MRLANTFNYRKSLGRVKRKMQQIVSQKDSDQTLFRNYITPIYHPSEFSSSMLNVTLIVHETGLPTSSAFIRLIGPLTHPSVSDRMGFEVTDSKELLIKEGTDVCIVQRTAIPTIREAKRLVSLLERRNIKLIVDNDDAFRHLDATHSVHSQQGEKNEAMLFLMKKAYEIWVSTSALQLEYADYGNTVVVGNTIDERVWPNLHNGVCRTPENDKPLRLVYMGTTTHGSDFALVKPVFDKLYKKYPNLFTLTVIGVVDDLSEKPWIEVQKPNHPIYPEFTKWFSSLEPFDIGIAPLDDTLFNQSKSDIKCLDYLAIGIRPIVSQVKAYDNKELDALIARVPNKKAAWFEILEEEIENRGKNRANAKQRIQAGYRYLMKERSTRAAAQLLYYRLMQIKKE